MTKHVHLTWYILTDGTNADPDDCAPGEDGVLRHKNGMAVALRETGVPMTIGVAAVTGKNSLAAEMGEAGDRAEPPVAEQLPLADDGQAAAEAKEVKPEKPKRGYKTRDAKAG